MKPQRVQTGRIGSMDLSSRRSSAPPHRGQKQYACDSSCGCSSKGGTVLVAGARRARATQYNSVEMSILKIARMGHPALRVKARPIERADIRGPALQKLIDDMIETMIEYRGVGLAAPQVHEGLRLFVATLDADDDKDQTEDENTGEGEREKS